MTERGNSGFNRLTVLGIVVFGFAAFLAMLYFIGAGDTGKRPGGDAHAAADGLNGYSGFAKMLELEGYPVDQSRARENLDTYGLLVLTPPLITNSEALDGILEDRSTTGPTMVILPKWFAGKYPDNIPDEIKDKIEDDWVRLYGANSPGWTDELAAPYGFETEGHGNHVTEGVFLFANDDEEKDPEEPTSPANWAGYGLTGSLPTTASLSTDSSNRDHRVLVTDNRARSLAFEVLVPEQSPEEDEFYDYRYPVYFVVEPDLVNNFGLSDPERAALALRLIEDATNDETVPITFDLTLNGLGNTTNLLTLAFQPPFLAATLCLIFALLIMGWRAFLRFGPAAATEPEIAFGKHRLVANGAGLIVRARRHGLLAEPFTHIIGRRIASRLGLPRAEADAIDAALAKRLGQPNLFSTRSAELARASGPADIVRAARALKELEGEIDT